MQIKRFNKGKENIVGFILNGDLYSIDSTIYRNFKIIDESQTRIKPEIRKTMEQLYKKLIELEKVDEQIIKLQEKKRKIHQELRTKQERVKKVYQSESNIVLSEALIDKIIEVFENTSLKRNVRSKVKDGISEGYVYFNNYKKRLDIYIPVDIVRHPRGGEYGVLYREYDGSMSSYNMSEAKFNDQLSKAQFKKWSSLKSFISMFEVKDKNIKNAFDFGVIINDKTAELYLSVSYIFSKAEFKKEEVSEILKKFKNVAKTL